jgi:hypothetical protein
MAEEDARGPILGRVHQPGWAGSDSSSGLRTSPMVRVPPLRSRRSQATRAWKFSVRR